ncbi:hypothetical protein POF51_29475 [Brevibacillus sp. AG]|uniref:DUF6884 domain-containing protein n=1 Tax=Brevibacillus sp. AG TaxID=3020891 RepID=UPI00232F3AB0|nr:DUF6884 domain-containing protein [Brevibacillus sp. AG]MDC0764855.1 hypothetical protein [Brevibacillus sp. AG]
MKDTVVLISCTKKKQPLACEAEMMYSPSSLFSKALCYAKQHLKPDHIFILSAKYGLLPLDQVIEPYEKTLNNLSSIERKQWAKIVNEQLAKLPLKKAIFLAGSKYREDLIPILESLGIECEVPLKGLGIGEQLGYYTRELKGFE